MMDLYYLPFASPSRAAVFAADVVGVKLNKIVVNTFEQEQLKPEFLKINPQHTIPTLVDNGFSVWESRAIMIYLAEKYGKDDSLYPKDPQKKALVNQRLFFDLGVLTQSFAEYYYPIFRDLAPQNPDGYKKIETAFGFLNTFLEGQQFVAGDHLTIADLALLTTVTTFLAVRFNIDAYPNVKRWYETAPKGLAGWKENVEAAKEYTTRLDKTLKK